MHQPLVWIAATMAGYAAVANLFWAVELEPERFGRLGRRLQAARNQGWWVAGLTVSRGLYYLGVPALAVALRVVRPSHMGLTGPRLETLPLAVAITVAVGAVLAGGRLWLDLTTGRGWQRAIRPPVPQAMGWIALNALQREAHWAFFRSGPLSAGLRTTPAVFVGLGLLALEGWSNPWRRAAFEDAAAARQLTEHAGLAVLSALVFLATASSLACLAAHIALAGTLAALEPQPSGRAETRPPHVGPRYTTGSSTSLNGQPSTMNRET